MTIKTAKKQLRRYGIVLRHHVDFDEYCVNYADGDNATAYFTTDITDAVNTGLAMAEYRLRHIHWAN